MVAEFVPRKDPTDSFIHIFMTLWPKDDVFQVSESFERDILRSSAGTNVHLDLRMSWLEFGVQNKTHFLP